MDEQIEATEFISVGERLRSAREEKGFSLEDIASETRIPLRHLESLEAGDWEKLPAPTYSIGFAKSYASAVGLDRSEIGEQLRDEMGGVRNDSSSVEHFEPADPARAMPKWLVLSAIVGIIVVVLVFSWIRNQSLTQAPSSDVAGPAPVGQAPPEAPAPPPAQPAVAEGPVVLTATGAAWIRVTDGARTLYEGVLQPGQTYRVPPSAGAPQLRAGAPEALRIDVGNAVAPPIGPAGQVVDHVSLKPVDLMQTSKAKAGPQAAGAPAQNSLAP